MCGPCRIKEKLATSSSQNLLNNKIYRHCSSSNLLRLLLFSEIQHNILNLVFCGRHSAVNTKSNSAIGTVALMKTSTSLQLLARAYIRKLHSYHKSVFLCYSPRTAQKIENFFIELTSECDNRLHSGITSTEIYLGSISTYFLRRLFI